MSQSEQRRCILCHKFRPLEAFNESPDGSGLKTLCRVCEIYRKMELKARGLRSCHDCGAPTVNYRCRKCWRRLCGASPLDSLDDGAINEVSP